MKTTLNILKVFCTLLVISAFLDFVKRLHKVLYYFFNNDSERLLLFNMQIPENWSDTVYNILAVISLGLITYMVLLLVDFRHVIFNFSKAKVFTEENSKKLRAIGKGLIIYGIVIASLDIILGVLISDSSYSLTPGNSPSNSGYEFGHIIGVTISKRLPIFLVALFIQFISFILVKGNELQDENDLTI
ncbi:DUF2975 domain-containing protein [Tenacibaculum sp. AHE15PA]|uniref:DUF2975 domain-containing protein n=1 Tax=unclassified Tenacibaculum TaxID=2635139 RepID=UPI001C4F8563|nr:MULTISPECIES: DUF2975 domain-containing protein [unclassified Tenacibaculum]QXP72864.1 DUF2975 domain-containing protein [Tenacibaculum sp. AHE14PA]QXP76778.1 DUF2975 domain-containing protein [Tenacibaculum sp. AHE15PA]